MKPFKPQAHIHSLDGAMDEMQGFPFQEREGEELFQTDVKSLANGIS